MPLIIKKGFPNPLGVKAVNDGINFALYIKNRQTQIKLIIQNLDTKQVMHSIPLKSFSGRIAHVFIQGLPSSFIYYYNIEDKELLDPYALYLDTPHEWNDRSNYDPKGVYISSEAFDWEEDAPPSIRKEDLIIYEMHIRGFTQDPTSQVQYPGSYLGMIEKIDHLKSLGINAVELLPIYEFNPYEYPKKNSSYYGKIMQYWGYSTVNFFSPMNRYAGENGHGKAQIEFKRLVKALHQAGIEVILDVVYNHTAEGGREGPLFNYKLLGKDTYYILDEKNEYANYTGCGNTLKCNHPVSIELIMASLRYWVTEMHVDGFRFDLASIFYRGEDGSPLDIPSMVEFITKDPILANVKLIAEPWDAVGLFQVGKYSKSTRWSEWNAYYRDAVRQFIIGRPRCKGEFATRLTGSEDLYAKANPQKSINFVVCHDGFSLHDLVSYNEKHNEENGENNRDGTDHNLSWNCGEEGKTDNPNILDLRIRQMKNFHLALMISQGIPMLHMGDEYGHTKDGNNNTWCQDNVLNWFQWELLKQRQDFFLFYKGLIQFRNETSLLKNNQFLNDTNIEWHGKSPYQPNWHLDDHFIAFTLKDQTNGLDLYAAFNASMTKTIVNFPHVKEGKFWNWIANTSNKSDFYDKKKRSIRCLTSSYEMLPYSSLLLQIS